MRRRVNEQEPPNRKVQGSNLRVDRHVMISYKMFMHRLLLPSSPCVSLPSKYASRALRIAIAIAAGAILVNAAPARAQQDSFQLDQPSWRTGAQNSQTESIPPTGAWPAPAQPALEIPSAYLGCWEGAPRPDAWHQYSGPRIGKWVPSTVTLCFVRRPSGIEVTYHKQSLDEAVNQGRIFNTRSRTFALASNGDRIALRSYGSAQEHARIFGLFNAFTIDLNWTADANCTLSPDRQTMLVDESMNQSCSGTRQCNGGRFISAVWHGELHRTAMP
jgi:hypothetical protein